MSANTPILFAYELRRSFMHSCDPISKVLWVVCFSLLTISITRAIPQLFLLFIVITIGIFGAKIALRETGLIVIVFSIFSLGWFIIQAFLIGGDNIIFKLGPLSLAMEGVDAAGSVAFRSVVLVLLARIFVSTTDPRELGLEFVQILKFPYTFAFSIFFMLRLLPLLEEEFINIRDARIVRGLGEEKGIAKFFTYAKEYTTALLVRGFRRAVITAYSLESRAFRANSNRTYTKIINISTSGRLLILFSLLFFISCIILILKYHL